MKVVMDEKLSKYVGSRVEVCYKDNGFGSIWYKAIIELPPLTKLRSKYRECVRLLKDDFATPFTKLSKNVLVRPVPPVHVEAHTDVKKGCVVDACRKDEWWVGLVVKVIEKDKCLVFFDSPPDVVQFERKDLRPHLDWIEEKYWVVRGSNLTLLRRLTEECVFSSGTMVEVSCKINKVEVVWVPAMIVKETEEVDKESEEGDEETEKDDKETEEGDEETDKDDKETEKDAEETDKDDKEAEEGDEETEKDDEETEKDDESEEEIEEIEEIGDDEKKYIVKFCDKSLSCMDDKARPNRIVGLGSIRPTPPSFWVEEYQLMEYVEVFHGTRWRQGKVMGFLPERRYIVLFNAINMEGAYKHSELRPLKVWENGIWKTKELPLTQALGNKMAVSVTNGSTPLLTKEYGPPVTPSLRNSEDSNRKRKREENVTSVASVEENKANDSTMDLPFVKNLRIWKTLESMEVFKTVPHFSPLVETRESSRETSAIGLMYAYSDLLEEVKNLQLFSPVSRLDFLNDSLTELEKHGFDVKVPQSRIQKILSLKVKQAKKTEELKGFEKEIAEEESKKVEIEQKILELQRKKEKLDKELEDVELQMENLDYM